MTFNSLLMFDIVFVFFLFLVGVTCLVYYLPPARTTAAKSCRHHSHYHHHHSLTHRLHRSDCGGNSGGGGLSSPANIADNCSATVEFFTTNPKSIDVEKVAATSASPQCCYVKAKQCDIKQCTGPVQDV